MHDHQAIESWLKKTTRGQAAANVLGAVGVFLLALVVLFIAFWVVYVVIYLAFDWLLPHTHTVRLWISFGVLVLLFIGNVTTDRAYLETYSFTTGTHNDRPVYIDLPLVVPGSTVNPLAPDTAHSYVKMLTNILYTGPRMVTSAFRMLGRARRLTALDIPGCAAVLAFLTGKDAKVPFREAARAVPRGHDVTAVLNQLHGIDGVLFLKSEPAGLSLLSDFRAELRRLTAGVLDPEEEPEVEDSEAQT